MSRSRTSGRVRAALASVAATMVGATLLAVPAQAAPAAAAAPAIAWKDCGGPFECATVRAPLDHDNPGGATIGVAVIRLPASQPARRIGALMINPGGPGGSGVDVVRGIGRFLPAEMRARFDIVGFDPRGTNRSTPLRCFRTFEEALSVFPPFAYPDLPHEEEQLRELDDRFGAACRQRGGPILDQMSTADVARDMDFLRAAMGDQKTNFLGFSYGSMLGQTYANLFPSRVRAMVIDGVLDPVAWTTGAGAGASSTPFSTRLGSAVGAANTLGEFFRLCDAARRDCAFSGGASGRYAQLGERLRGHPVVIEEGGFRYRFTYQDLIGSSLGAMYAPFIWPAFADFLRELEKQLSPQAMGARLGTVRTGLGLTSTTSQERYPNFVESFPGVACADSDNPREFRVWQNSADRAEADYGRFARLWHWIASPCRVWPATAKEDRYTGPWTARTAAPVLIVGNYFDPATPYHGAQAAARLLPNSRLLSYAGWGHTAYLSGSACVDGAVQRYLLNVQLPPAGTVCPATGSPFASGGVQAAEVAVAAGADPAITAAVLPPSVKQALHAD